MVGPWDRHRIGPVDRPTLPIIRHELGKIRNILQCDEVPNRGGRSVGHRLGQSKPTGNEGVGVT